MEKGDIYWADFGESQANEPAYRRPVLVVQSDHFNRSRIGSVLVVPLSSNKLLAKAPGNVLLKRKETGLNKESVAVVSQMIAINHDRLEEKVSKLPGHLLLSVDEGLRLVLDL